ncbi:hypothetical protein V6N13_118448 [Hibiscus sabdariffa]
MFFNKDKGGQQSPGKVYSEPKGEMDGMPRNLESDKGNGDESRALGRMHDADLCMIDEIPILEDMSNTAMEFSQIQYATNPITISTSSASDDTVELSADDLYMDHPQEE